MCVSFHVESTDDKINDRQFKLIGRCLTEFKMQAQGNQTGAAAQYATSHQPPARAATIISVARWRNRCDVGIQKLKCYDLHFARQF